MTNTTDNQAGERTQYRMTQSATLKLTPRGDQVEITVIDKDFNDTRKNELNDLENLASMALGKIKGLSYRGAFKRLMLNQHPAETRRLEEEITVKASVTWVSSTGYVNMQCESESAEVVGE